MNKQVPSVGKILVMVGFALLCFVLLLWLWLAFGGHSPLKPKGYQVTIPFGEATQLAQEADVRISGVNVGKVKQLQADKRTGRSIATIEMKPEFAPLPVNTKATLRQKTLVGETYIALTPGSRTAKKIPEGGRLARANVAPTVELDEVLRSFDPQTREALSNWIYQQAVAFNGRGRALSDAIGNLPGFEQEATKLLDTLNTQSAETRAFVRDTGEMLAQLTERDGQLRRLIRSSNRVLNVTSRRNRELTASIRALPTFELEAAATVRRLTRFARDTDPLVGDLLPSARDLDATIRELALAAPDLEALMRALGPLEVASRRGLPATTEFLQQLRRFLPEVDRPLAELAPILDGAHLYQSDITAMVANATAATNLTYPVNGDPADQTHVLRAVNPITPESFAQYERRLPTNRQNAYTLPNSGAQLLTGQPVLDARSCGPDLTYTIDGNGQYEDSVIDALRQVGLAGGTPSAPPCVQQPRFVLDGRITRYPQVRANIDGLKPGLPVP